MMASIDDEVQPQLSMLVNMYENERFWMGGGFSKKGLLPTDRKPYSSKDGSLSWKTLEEAEEATLGKGWTYTEHELKTLDTLGDEVWSYCKDFGKGSILGASPKRRMTDFVRRRKIVRRQKFDPCQFLSRDVFEKCSNGDSNVIETLSCNLLEALSLATRLQQNNAQHDVLRDSVVIPLKNKLISSLAIGSPLTQRATGTNANPALARLEMVYKELDGFGERQQSVLSKAFQFFDRAVDEKAFKSEVSFNYFPMEERQAISKLVLKYLDPEFVLHCNEKTCGVECEFYWMKCTNPGCEKIMSQKYLAKHDSSCDFKSIPCSSECGDTFPRHKLGIHLQDACCNRERKCPFHTLGCTAVTYARDTAQHLEQNTNSHLLVMKDRMMEYQSVMSQMNVKIEKLQKENVGLRQQLLLSNAERIKDTAGVSIKIKDINKKFTGLEHSTKYNFQKIQKAMPN